MLEKILRQTLKEMGQHTVAISMAALLQYQLITGKVVALEKVSFSDTENLKVVR